MVTAVAGVLLLAGCGLSGDELFSNLNGTGASHSQGTDTSGTTGTTGTSETGAPWADAPPNYADNNRVRIPGEMSPQDEKRAGQKAAEVKRALEDLRRRGKISPAEVQPVLAELAASDPLSVTGLRSLWSDKARGSSYGIWIGKTACVTGAVSKDRVWADANGHYLESGCLPPPPTH
ncbi:hypothetical protein ABZ840_07105 [Streptomyces sp. NPDC047117]|uniref:hypothetical protein n=1 Tax=Streptomyces sp. NPDC047117 TaxID=3155379 RepID=UPI0033DC93A7